MIIYQVLPRFWGRGLFDDWDTPAFDYLKTLNVDAVWFTGVIRHATGKPYVKGDPGSPYSIQDYHDVNPYLANDPEHRMEEFEALVARTHRAGLKVFIDLVPNHVSPDCKDVPTHSWYDYDWTDTRKIDYGRREAWDAMLEIALFWAGKGVDGFRCDMIEMVPPEFLKWLVAEVRKRYPRFIFIGEVYERNNYRRYIDDVRFDLLYDKSGLYDTLRAVICQGASARGITRNWQFLQDMQPRMLNFLENHDEQRFASAWFAGDARKAFPALAVDALFNGASFMLYAGQEVGLDASEGAEGRTSIFNWTHPEGLRNLYAHIMQGSPLDPSAAALLARYREILSPLGSKAFRQSANYDLCWCNSVALGFDPEKHFAFLRYWRSSGAKKSQAMLVVCNFSDQAAEMQINIPEDLRQKKELCWLPQRVRVCVKPWDVHTQKKYMPFA